MVRVSDGDGDVEVKFLLFLPSAYLFSLLPELLPSMKDQEGKGFLVRAYLVVAYGGVYLVAAGFVPDVSMVLPYVLRRRHTYGVRRSLVFGITHSVRSTE